MPAGYDSQFTVENYSHEKHGAMQRNSVGCNVLRRTGNELMSITWYLLLSDPAGAPVSRQYRA